LRNAEERTHGVHDNEWLSPEELADHLKVPVATVYRWRYTGSAPVAHKIGRHVRFRSSDVEAWINQQRDAD
jgi:excisionase family DNA binding protein